MKFQDKYKQFRQKKMKVKIKYKISQANLLFAFLLQEKEKNTI